MNKDWETAYKVAIPKFIRARDSLEYRKAVAEFYANLQDSHGFISKSNEGFSLGLNPLIQDRVAYKPPLFNHLIYRVI